MRPMLLPGAAVLCFLAGQAPADDPVTARDFYERGIVHERNRRYDEALAAFSRAIELDPVFAEAYFSRSSIYSGRPSLEKRDYRKAVADLSELLTLEPQNSSARFNRALCYEQLCEHDKALADYSNVIDGEADLARTIGPDEKYLALTHHYRGRVYHWHKRDYRKAVEDYTAALKLDPDIEMVHYRRGQAFRALKDYARAQKDFAVALKRDPEYPNLLNEWARQLATCPDPDFRDGGQALQLASRAVDKSSGKRFDCLDTLAAAHAETGDFSAAIQSQQRALELLPVNHSEREAAESRLKLYAAGRPYREE